MKASSDYYNSVAVLLEVYIPTIYVGRTSNRQLVTKTWVSCLQICLLGKSTTIIYPQEHTNNWGYLKEHSQQSHVSAKKNLYLSLVRSQLTYCSPVWRPQLLKHISFLEKVQRRLTKYILNDFESDYKSRFISLNLFPLMYWIELADIMLLVTLLKQGRHRRSGWYGERRTTFLQWCASPYHFLRQAVPARRTCHPECAIVARVRIVHTHGPVP